VDVNWYYVDPDQQIQVGKWLFCTASNLLYINRHIPSLPQSLQHQLLQSCLPSCICMYHLLACCLCMLYRGRLLPLS
jgi:hypothetical protein